MSPEPNPESPLFPERLEAALLHGPVADVTELLHSSSEASYVRAAIGLEQAIRCFESGQSDDLVIRQVMECSEQPKVMARCFYELERLDRQRALDLLAAADRYSADRWVSSEVLEFLDRLRESGDGGTDGGAGDREPRLPHDPHDADGIALERPEVGTGFLNP